MKAVIVHYHLNPGGVTRIIESQTAGIHSVSAETELTVLCGSNHGHVHLGDAGIIIHGELEYWNARQQEGDFNGWAESIAKLLRQHLTNRAVLHCHNPNLGKNPALTLAVYQLASEGYPVVNHCHDFPEDRPQNMSILHSLLKHSTGTDLSEILYPGFPACHFVVLNSCDLRRIREQGIPASRIHLLPNPVSLHKTFSRETDQALKKKICRILGFDPSRKICTYPVRAIERKNLGEFLLLAVLFEETAHFTVTQPPMNPVELPRYQRWKTFCHENGLPVKFESGKEVDHEELINISDFCITTSIREGFGMVYLEPWLAGTPVIGRDLPCITADLVKYGIEYSRLYTEIRIENEGQMSDFKDLDPESQEKIIHRLIRQKSFRSKVLSDNPFLVTLLDDFPTKIILRNQSLIKVEFSLEKYGKRLLEIYREVSG